MRHRWIVIAAALFVVAAAVPAASAVQEVRVGMYMLNLGKLDISTGAFTADFYLSLKSDQPIASNSFEFRRGRATSVELLEDNGADGAYEKFYRIQASLSTPIDLRRFPFDTQRMQIIFEDKTLTEDKMRYVVNEKLCGLDPSILFPGWRIQGWDASTASEKYDVYEETFSQFVYSVGIEKIPFNSFLKTFLPVLFLMLIVVSSFILNPEQVTTRLAAVSSTLMACTMFHIGISNQIPPVSYMTFADKFMITTYLLLLCCFFLNIRIFMLNGKNLPEKAKKLNKLAEHLVFIGVPVFYAALFLFVR